MPGFFSKHVASTLVLGLLLTYAVYQVASLYIAFTTDAYVTSDIVGIAPQVAGLIAELPIEENQRVQVGDLLFAIEPRPFELAVQEKTARLTLASAGVSAAKDSIALARAEHTVKEALRADSEATVHRIRELFHRHDMSKQQLDDSERDFRVADAQLVQAQAGLQLARKRLGQQTAQLEMARVALAIAEYDLERTRVLAPISGRLAPFQLRSEDYVKTGEVVLAVVSDHNWRVVANLKDRHLAGLKPGQPVWLTVASEPWRIHRGRVESIAPGIAREAQRPGALPYVEPNTDWIRLSRRFPVRIDLEELPRQRTLYHGADARVLLLRD